MAYAVVVTGGKQYRVTPGQTLKIEKLGVGADSEYIFDKVLLMVNGEDVQIGRPLLAGIGIKARVIANGRDDKIVVFKYKRKTGYRRKTGHRQSYSLVKIEEIISGLAEAPKTDKA